MRPLPIGPRRVASTFRDTHGKDFLDLQRPHSGRCIPHGLSEFLAAAISAAYYPWIPWSSESETDDIRKCCYPWGLRAAVCQRHFRQQLQPPLACQQLRAFGRHVLEQRRRRHILHPLNFGKHTFAISSNKRFDAIRCIVGRLVHARRHGKKLNCRIDVTRECRRLSA